MIIFVEHKDSGKELGINSDYIIEIEPFTDQDGKQFSRVYMRNYHRTFIDINEAPRDIYGKIKSACENVYGCFLLRISDLMNEIRHILDKKLC